MRRRLPALLLLLSACGHAPPPALAPRPADARSAADQNLRMDSMAEGYYDDWLEIYPVAATSAGESRLNHVYTVPWSPDSRARLSELNRRWSERLGTVDRAALDAQRRLTYDVLRQTLESAMEGERFPTHLVPLNQFFNFTASFAQMGSGNRIHPFRTVADYDAFLERIRGFEQAVDVTIANMREGVVTGIVQPRVLMERVLPQLAAHLVDDPSRSVFWGPISSIPGEFSAADRARLTAAYDTAIRSRVVPAYRRLHDFVRDEYLPRTRSTVGLSALPGGREWYEYLARAQTTTRLTPDEIHAIGLSEVARIHGEMESLMRRVGWQGDLLSFMAAIQNDPRHRYATREEMLADYRAAQARIDSSTSRLFDLTPKANYVIRAVEAFRERSASNGSYVPASPDGAQPGVFYLNTYDPQSRARYEMVSLLVHEGSPGHHFQLSIARELQGLPRMRRFTIYTAYAEGWALYAETLGAELELYQDPYQQFGYLTSELWRAIRLVLDTGIHARGWTLDQAMEYARRNSAQSEAVSRAEVERFAAIPGQGLAYKVGEMRITGIRRRAEGRLGARFDVRAFHRAVLEDGALPLDVLEAKMDRWIESQLEPSDRQR